jgi:CubicO group peptidase (beta-lactamase class C family)
VGATNGFTTEEFSGVREVLEKNLASGADVGASVTVHHRGEVVVDIWGGYTDVEKTTPWESDTLVNVWSTTKTMTFLISLMLLERGELDFDAPVAKYWPEFAAAGKKEITFRQVLSHTAGLSGFSAPMEVKDLADWEFCVQALAAQEPWWEPGTQSGYHAVTQGYLIGEVVRRITGTTIGEFFQEEVAKPLGANFFIGLPEAEESKVSVVLPPPPVDPSVFQDLPMAIRTFTSPLLDATAPQHRWWRAAEIPAANGHGNARSVALVQAVVAQGGESQGVRLLKEKTLNRIFVTESNGPDLVLGIPVHFGAGYGLASESMPLGPRACYWGGYGGSVIIMDQDAQLTVSYMMNKMDSGLVGDTRGAELAFASAIAAAS